MSVNGKSVTRLRRMQLGATSIAGALLVAGALSGSAYGSSGHAKKGKIKSGAPIVIAADAALTGPYAVSTGIPYLDGVIMAVHQVNAAGGVDGHKLKLYTGNHQADPATGALLMQKFHSEGAKVVISNFTSILEAQGPIAQKYGMLLLNPGGEQDIITSFGKTVISTRPLAALEIKEVALLTKHSGAKTVAVAMSGSTATTAIQEMSSDAKAVGLKVVAQVNYPDSGDMTSYVEQIRSANPGAVWIDSTGDEGGLLVAALRAEGVSTPVWGFTQMFVPGSIQAGGSAMNGVTGVEMVPWNPTPNKRGVVPQSAVQYAWAKQFHKEFPSAEINVYAALHYDAVVNVLVPAIKYALAHKLPLSGLGLLKAVERLKTFPSTLLGTGLLAPTTRDMARPMLQVSIVNGAVRGIQDISVTQQQKQGIAPK